MSEHNWSHLYERAQERMKSFTPEEKETCHKTFLGIERKMREKRGNIPHEWHRPVMSGKKLLGFFVGSGIICRSFLSANMVPNGTVL